MIRAICSASNIQGRDRDARKYCLKATAVLYNQHQTFGTFVAYGKTIAIVKNVENACTMCLDNPDTFPGAVWDDIEVTLFEECPSECSARVFWKTHTDDFML